MSILSIYRSSAGSGKTHTLVVEYLKLVLDHPGRFAHILAVTFTNQATQEMKRRILGCLYHLAQGIPGPVAEALQQHKGWSLSMLQERSQAVLSNILHQYTRFSVSTIDSFFQRIVQGFVQELGLQRGFRIELAQSHVLGVLVDDLIAAAGQDVQSRQWLVAFSEDKLLRGKPWNFKRELTSLGRALLTESFGEHEAQLVRATSDPNTLQHFLKSLYRCIHHFEHKLKQFGEQARAALTQARLFVDDFLYGQSGVVGYLVGLSTGGKWSPSQRALRALDSLEAWYKPSSDKRTCIIRTVQNSLQPCLREAVHFYDTHYQAYYTALEVRHLIYAFGIATSMLDRLKDYRSAHNVMLMTDISLLLRRIIADSETPFVYEKIGAFYRHFLIDEFQDISRFQWENFSPLIANSLHEGHASMVVGDVKQSIYRWRGGDWRLLLHQLEKDIEATTVVTLTRNWRSREKIVAFNNFLFSNTATALRQYFAGELSRLSDQPFQEQLLAQLHQMTAVYQNASQQPTRAPQDDKGYVNITFLKNASNKVTPLTWREMVKTRLPSLVETLQEDGFALRDIALLVRSNAEGREIFRTLVAHQQLSKTGGRYRYDVVSSESLYLAHSPWIRLLVTAMHCLTDETSVLIQAELSYLYQIYVLQATSDNLYDFLQFEGSKIALPEAFVAQKSHLKYLPLYELVAALIDIFNLRRTEAIGFVQAFEDVVLDFATQEIADVSSFLIWWTERGSSYTLPRTASQDAITLTTIHQAKGLQFKVVVVPFCSWDLDHSIRNPPTLWCATRVAPFNQFPVLPVRYSKRLRETVYAQAYYAEQMQAYLDHLNLLYVAFTRPIDRLYAFAPCPGKTTYKAVSDLLYQTFSEVQVTCDAPNDLKNAWDAAVGVFEMGTPLPVSGR